MHLLPVMRRLNEKMEIFSQYCLTPKDSFIASTLRHEYSQFYWIEQAYSLPYHRYFSDFNILTKKMFVFNQSMLIFQNDNTPCQIKKRKGIAMLKMQQVNITQEFNAPVEKVFAILSEHENLNKLFAPAKVTRLSDGQDARNGVGSARKLSIPLTPSFVETNLVYRENELIEYAITSGIAPIKAHRGVMKFTDLGNNRSRLDYTISFKGRVPFIGPIIKLALQNGVSRGLKKLKV